jgi:hypothetical protein
MMLFITRAQQRDVDGIVGLAGENAADRGATYRFIWGTPIMKETFELPGRRSTRIFTGRFAWTNPMFAELRRLLPRREGILFRKAANEPSLPAHRKMAMREGWQILLRWNFDNFRV